MPIPIDDAWRWLKTAPLPVVLTLTMLLAGWVWSLDSEQTKQSEQLKSAKETVEKTDAKVDRVEDKLDRLLEVVLELKAEQKAAERQPSTAPAPTPKPSKSQEK